MLVVVRTHPTGHDHRLLGLLRALQAGASQAHVSCQQLSQLEAAVILCEHVLRVCSMWLVDASGNSNGLPNVMRRDWTRSVGALQVVRTTKSMCVMVVDVLDKQRVGGPGRE
jgi:hypothetical protein